MLRAYKYRMYPNKEQQVYFAKTFGCVRFIYNKMLHDKIEHYKLTGNTLKNTPAQYKGQYPFLKEIDSLALANAQLNLQSAYNNFFRDKSVGFPNFKNKKHNRFSYTTNNKNGTISIQGNSIKLPKIKTLIKIKQHRSFNGVIKSSTISKNPAGRYHISLLVEEEIIKLPTLTNKIGVDLGIKDFAVCSNREVIDNPKNLRQSEKRLKKLQKDLSRKKKGSSNRNKNRLKVAKLHEKIKNQRNDFLNKLSSKLINPPKLLACL